MSTWAIKATAFFAFWMLFALAVWTRERMLLAFALWFGSSAVAVLLGWERSSDEG